MEASGVRKPSCNGKVYAPGKLHKFRVRAAWLSGRFATDDIERKAKLAGQLRFSTVLA